MTEHGGDFPNIIEGLQEDDPFHALFRQAEIQAIEEHLETREDLYVWEIGARAWSRLPLDDQPEAMRNLFVSYWHQDCRTREGEYFQKLADSGEPRMSEETLDNLTACVLSAPVDAETEHFVDGVKWSWIAEAVEEIKTLRVRLATYEEGASSPI